MTTIAKQGELTYIDANKNKTILYPITKSECVIGLESTTKTITIQPSEWVNGVYTLNDPLITETSNQDILPPVATGSNKAELDVIKVANIVDGGQSAGKAMFRCLGAVPTAPITLRVVFNSGHAKPTAPSREPIVKEVTVQPSQWVNRVFTYNDPLITKTPVENNLIWNAPEQFKDGNDVTIANMRNAIFKASIVGAGQENGKAYLKCEGTVPTITIKMKVVIL